MIEIQIVLKDYYQEISIRRDEIKEMHDPSQSKVHTLMQKIVFALIVSKQDWIVSN